MKLLFAVHLKHSNFWPSADVKPTSDEQAHAMHWQYMFTLSLSMCVYNELYDWIVIGLDWAWEIKL
jgi:hypothetical protein